MSADRFERAMNGIEEVFATPAEILIEAAATLKGYSCKFM